MIFRRIKAHIAKEDWFAVFIDFCIVVFGVFMGFQVTNWNDQRGDQQEYQLALERLRDEARANLNVLDEIDTVSSKSIATVTSAIEALRSCEHTQENVTLIEKGLSAISGTSTIHIQMSALDELTTTPELLSQQTSGVRNQISTTKFNLEVLKTEADFSESLPFRDLPEKSPVLDVGELRERKTNYHGLKLDRVVYPLVLAGRVDEACSDDQLVKSFYGWYRFQSSIPVYAAIMRAELEELLEIVGPTTGSIAK